MDLVGIPRFALDAPAALRASSRFVDRFSQRAGDDLATLWADTRIRVGRRGTADPAAWYDWIECLVNGAVAETDGPVVDEVQAFQVLTELIDWALGHFGERLALFQSELAMSAEASDPSRLIVWQVWNDRYLKCVEATGETQRPAKGAPPDCECEDARLDADGALQCASDFVKGFIARAGNDFPSLVNDLGVDRADMDKGDPGAWEEWNYRFAQQVARRGRTVGSTYSVADVMGALRCFVGWYRGSGMGDLPEFSSRIDAALSGADDPRLRREWIACLNDHREETSIEP